MCRTFSPPVPTTALTVMVTEDSKVELALALKKTLKQDTLVEDVHALVTHGTPVMRALTDESDGPKCSPERVTLAPPEAGAFR